MYVHSKVQVAGVVRGRQGRGVSGRVVDEDKQWITLQWTINH